ncbi:hypothetical protein CR513_11283, partial [Mucuna pruriens]
MERSCIRVSTSTGRVRLSTEFEIPSTTIPTAATIESASTWQLTIFGGLDEVVGDKQPRVLA